MTLCHILPVGGGVNRYLYIKYYVTSKFMKLFLLLSLYVYVCVCVYLPIPTPGRDVTQGQFLNGVEQFGIQSFLSKLAAWPRTQSALLFTHSCKENKRIHTLPKSINALWNAINFVQDLNTCHLAHFLWRQPLHHGCEKKNLNKIYIYIYIYIYIRALCVCIIPKNDILKVARSNLQSFFGLDVAQGD